MNVTHGELIRRYFIHCNDLKMKKTIAESRIEVNAMLETIQNILNEKDLQELVLKGIGRFEIIETETIYRHPISKRKIKKYGKKLNFVPYKILEIKRK